MFGRTALFREIRIVIGVLILDEWISVAVRKLSRKAAVLIGTMSSISRGLALHRAFLRIAIVMCRHKSSSMVVSRVRVASGPMVYCGVYAEGEGLGAVILTPMPFNRLRACAASGVCG